MLSFFCQLFSSDGRRHCRSTTTGRWDWKCRTTSGLPNRSVCARRTVILFIHMAHLQTVGMVILSCYQPRVAEVPTQTAILVWCRKQRFVTSSPLTIDELLNNEPWPSAQYHMIYVACFMSTQRAVAVCTVSHDYAACLMSYTQVSRLLFMISNRASAR